MTTPREGHATLSIRHPGDPSVHFLYAFGGRDDEGDALDTYEYATVTVAADGTHVLGEWMEGLQRLSIARSELGAWALTPDDTSAVPEGEVWVYVGPGRGAGQAMTRVEAARLDTLVNPGELEAFGNTTATGAGGRAGYGFGASSGWLFLFGGQGGEASSGTLKNEVCATDVGCLTFPTWTATGTNMSEERVLMGSTEESAFFFVAGGSSGTEEATSTVDRTVK